MFKIVFGGVVVTILLIIYVYLVGVAIRLVGCTPQPACLSSFTEPMASAMALIGGLVSAMVIAELAITKPGEAPLERAVTAETTPRGSKIIKLLTYVYLGVWTLVGLAAFMVGLQNPEVLRPLTDLGQGWFGLAVAAGYSYFGINPSS